MTIGGCYLPLLASGLEDLDVIYQLIPLEGFTLSQQQYMIHAAHGRALQYRTPLQYKDYCGHVQLVVGPLYSAFDWGVQYSG